MKEVIMDLCSSCSGNFSTDQDSIACCVCKCVFHPSCTRIKPETYKKLRSDKKGSWKCDICVKTSGSKNSGDDKNWEDMVNSLKESIVTLINARFDEFNEKITKISHNVETIKTSMSELKAENETLKTECLNLKTENIKYRNELNNLNQYSQIDNLEINGIPETQNENIYEILQCVAKKINVPFSRDQVSIAHRIPTLKDKIKPIICKFIQRQTKMKWLAAAKETRTIHTTDLHQRLAPGIVYINEHLTQLNKNILWRARELKKQGKIEFVWVKDSKLFVRENANSRTIRLINEEHIAKLEKKYTQVVSE